MRIRRTKDRLKKKKKVRKSGFLDPKRKREDGNLKGDGHNQEPNNWRPCEKEKGNMLRGGEEKQNVQSSQKKGFFQD